MNSTKSLLICLFVLFQFFGYSQSINIIQEEMNTLFGENYVPTPIETRNYITQKGNEYNEYNLIVAEEIIVAVHQDILKSSEVLKKKFDTKKNDILKLAKKPLNTYEIYTDDSEGFSVLVESDLNEKKLFSYESVFYQNGILISLTLKNITQEKLDKFGSTYSNAFDLK